MDDREPLFGDDRVADVLLRDPSRAPVTFAEHEALFGVGRACARPDSREIFVIEERATRFAEVLHARDAISPRAIVTGCSPDPQSLDGVAVSFGLLTVMPTDPARDAADPLARAPIEVMALDRATGRYNFYVFDARGVERIVRRSDGAIVTVLGARDGSIAVRSEAGPRCFGCHVQGGPVMPTLADPWTGWVSTRSERPLGAYSGETAAIVRESNVLSSDKRASFANALEGVMRNAIRAYVASGLVDRTLDGREPGGLPRLLRSVFCETELQLASTFETVPLQLFLDPAAVAGSGITRPISSPGDDFPQLLPIRSEIDLRIEEQLIARGVLSRETARAIRLLDDERDVLSPRRCAVLDRALLALPSTNVDAHLRAIVRDALPIDAAYARALTEGRDDAALREAYFADARARFERMRGDRAMLRARLEERQRAARALFPGPASPLPFVMVQ